MSKISLKNGKTLEFKNNRWYYNGKPTNKTHIILDTDGYYKKVMPDGTLAVQDYDENGKPNKISYIGGDKQESRDKYWKQAPIVRHAVDSVAKEYGINPNILRHRLNEEGFVDQAIKENNFSYLDSRKELKQHPESYDAEDFNRIIRSKSNYDRLIFGDYNGGFNQFGLDDVATLINEGKVKPIKEQWYDTENENEHGRDVLSANGHTNADNLGLTAATLKYFRNEAVKDFPNANRIFLDEAAGIYYNRGVSGGRRYIKKK